MPAHEYRTHTFSVYLGGFSTNKPLQKKNIKTHIAQ